MDRRGESRRIDQAEPLADYNAQAAGQPLLPVRLRVVVHAGEVEKDGRGFYGEALDIAFRLLDSPLVKETLKQSPAPLVLVVSDEFYTGTVKHIGAMAGVFNPIQVQVTDREKRLAWVHVPAPR